MRVLLIGGNNALRRSIIAELEAGEQQSHRAFRQKLAGSRSTIPSRSSKMRANKHGEGDGHHVALDQNHPDGMNNIATLENDGMHRIRLPQVKRAVANWPTRHDRTAGRPC